MTNSQVTLEEKFRELKDWHRSSFNEHSSLAQECIRYLISFIGDDPDRDGLKETPERVIRSYSELFRGYGNEEEEIANLFKTFDGEKYDEMVVLKGVQFYSMCEHHMLPFFGKAHVAYVPNGPIIGLSKMARLVDLHARRLQNQERLTQAITSDLRGFLKPLGAACVIQARHFCLCARGAGKQDAEMITSSMIGCFRDDTTSATRAEFLSLIKD